MRRMTQVLNNDGLRMTYAEAAMQLGITVQALRNKLSRHRKLTGADTVYLRDLARTYPAARYPLLNAVGERISYDRAAAHLEINRTELYRLVALLAYPSGASIPIKELERYVGKDSDGNIWINMNGEFV